MKTIWAIAVFIIVTFFLATVDTRGVTYSFTSLAEYHDFEGLGGDVAINDRGEVAAIVFRNFRQEVVRFSGRDFTIIAHTEDPQFANFSYISGISINNHGAVAFTADTDDGRRGLYIGSGEAINTIFVTDPGNGSGSTPINPHFVRDPSLNDAGRVTFRGHYSSGGGFNSILLGGHGDLLLIADETGSFDLEFPPSINNTNTVAFGATLNNSQTAVVLGSSDSGNETLYSVTAPPNAFILLGNTLMAVPAFPWVCLTG